MYDVGDIVPLGLSVSDSDGAPANGGTVTVTVGLPDGTTATPIVTAGDTGQYTADYAAVQEGRHTVSWTVTGANASAYQDVFNVREITDQVLGLSEARRQLGFTTTDHDDDLRLFIAAAGQAVEDHTGTTLVRRTVTEKHWSRGKLWLGKTPALTLTSVAAVDGSVSYDTSELDLRSDIGLVTALTGPILCGYIGVTYVAGSKVIPANYLLAVRIITEHLWQTMRPFSTSSASLAPGAFDDSLDARTGGLVGFAIPNRALELLGTPPPLVG